MAQFKFVSYDRPPANGDSCDYRTRLGTNGPVDRYISRSPPADDIQLGIGRADAGLIDSADEGDEGVDAVAATTLVHIANEDDTLEPSLITRPSIIDLCSDDSDDDEATHTASEPGSVPALAAHPLVEATPDRLCDLLQSDAADDGVDAEMMSSNRQPSVTDCARIATLRHSIMQFDAQVPLGTTTDEDMDNKSIAETNLDETISENDDDGDDDSMSEYQEPSRSLSPVLSEALSETSSAADIGGQQATMSKRRRRGKTVTRSKPLKPGGGITKHHAQPERFTQPELFLSILKQFVAAAATGDATLSFTVSAESCHDGSFTFAFTPCKGVQEAPRSPPSSQSSSPGRKRFTFEEDEFLRQHKGEQDLPWEDIHRRFCGKFGYRSPGALQVHYSNKLKGTCLSDRNQKLGEGKGSRSPNSDASSTSTINIKSPKPSAHDNSDIDLVPDFKVPSSRPNPLLALPIPFSDKDVHCCDICKLPINAKQLRKIQKARFSRVKVELCHEHNREAAVRYWQQGGYPAIKWDRVTVRCSQYHKDLRKLLSNPTNCHSYKKLLELLGNRSRRKAVQELRYSGPPPYLSAGYYGLRGTELLLANLIQSMSDELHRLAVSNPLVREMGKTMFVQWILVPEIVIYLIMEDFNFNEEMARKALEETALLGELVNDLDDM